MSYVVYHKEFPRQDRRYFETLAGARRSATCSNRNAGQEVYVVLEDTVFDQTFPAGTKVVKNLMSGELIEISEDTPYCCDPSQERYWTM